MDPYEDAELSSIVKSQTDRYAAPSTLRKRIITSIRQADVPYRHESKIHGWQQWLNMSAAFVAGIVASIFTAYFLIHVSTQERLAHEVVASHVRSLMGDHLADMASSDRHTVKPWFAGKLDFSPPVHDLAKAGFPLVGGRLDYINGRPVAALIYQRRQHTINVFVWPRVNPSPAPPAVFATQGFNVTGWKDDAMQFWLVSDLNAEELRQFAQQLREAVSHSDF